MKKLFLWTLLLALLGTQTVALADTTSVLLVPAKDTTSVIHMFDPFDGHYLGELMRDTVRKTRYNATQGPDGNIYVSSSSEDAIFVYDNSGNYLYTYADTSDGIRSVKGIDFRGDSLFVPNGYHLAVFDGPHSRLPDFVDSVYAYGCTDISFLEDGRFLMSIVGTDYVVRLFNADGTWSADLFSTSGHAHQIHPDPQLPGAYLNVTHTAAGNGIITDFDIDGTIHNVILSILKGSGIYRLGNGNLLLSSSGGVYEINNAGDTVNVVGPDIGGCWIELCNVIPPIGRCCYGFPSSCIDTTGAKCIELGGFWSRGLNCTDNPCPPSGACCDDETGECQDNVSSLNCPFPLRFEANTLCADLDPPCGHQPCVEDSITVEIQTDDYGSETTWEIVEQGTGIVVASGGPYEDAPLLYTINVCVDSTGCYDFTIYDEYEDGICCEYGEGYYNVYLNGQLLCTGGEFGASETCPDIGNGCECPEDEITVEIQTDDYGSETTWEIVEQGTGIVVASGGPYEDAPLLYTINVCVDSTGCYDFTIYDAYEDGICCDYGEGYYNVYLNGQLICSGAEFGASETCPNIGNGCGCAYVPGDCDNDGTPLELGDVIAMIGMYRGSVDPYYICDCGVDPPGAEFAATADPNGNCVALELGDVVTEIGAYRGTAEASGCADCPGQGILAPGDENRPLAVPSAKHSDDLRSKVKVSEGANAE